MTSQFHFEQFPIYIAAEHFILDIQPYLKTKHISLSTKDQLHRAAMSFALNIAEGSGKYAKTEKCHYYTIARGSTHECVAVLRIMKLQQRLSESEFRSSYIQLTTISQMLSGLIKVMAAIPS